MAASMKAAKIISFVILVLVAGLFAAWWAFVRAPGPAEVCDHIIDVTIAEAQATGMSREAEADVIERTREECIQHKRDKIQLRGRLDYADYAKCVVSAKTLDEIYKC